MKATEGKIGRVFILQLEDDDKLPSCIENFAKEKGIKTGYVNFIAGIKTGNVIADPHDRDARPVKTINVNIDDAHESAALGLISANANGDPILHIHGFFGRNGETLSGCLRNGVDVWVTGEAIIYEITGATCVRELEENTGFALLRVGKKEAVEMIPETEPIPQSKIPIVDTTDGHSHILHLFNASIN